MYHKRAWWTERSRSKEYQEAYDTITSHIPKSEKVVEFCCGSGELTERILLAEKAEQFVATDLDIDFLSHVKMRLYLNGFYMDGQSYKFYENERISLVFDDCTHTKLPKNYFDLAILTFPSIKPSEAVFISCASEVIVRSKAEGADFKRGVDYLESFDYKTIDGRKKMLEQISKDLMSSNIDKEKFAHLVFSWAEKFAFEEIAEVIKPGGLFMLVHYGREVSKPEIKVQEEFCESLSLTDYIFYNSDEIYSDVDYVTEGGGRAGYSILKMQKTI
jgi:SAM-dependent methyltransferase